MPDEVVRAANEIELVDVSPQLLRTRLSDGQIYKEAVSYTHLTLPTDVIDV